MVLAYKKVQGGPVAHTCAYPSIPLLPKAAEMGNINYLSGLNYVVELKGTLMQVEKVLKKKVAYVLTLSNIISVCK